MKNVIYACLLFCGAMTTVAAAASSAFAQGTPPTLVKELVAVWQRAAADLIDVAEAMPEEKDAYKPTPEISTFRDQQVHLTGTPQRFMHTRKGIKSARGPPRRSIARAASM